MNERILQALYNLAVDAQMDYEQDCPIIPWEETSRGVSFIELQDAISEALYNLAGEYEPNGSELDDAMELY